MVVIKYSMMDVQYGGHKVQYDGCTVWCHKVQYGGHKVQYNGCTVWWS